MVKHYLVTGGAGFVGSHLSEALLERGHRVTVIDDLSTGRFENIAHLSGNSQFRFAIDSITNEVVMDRLVAECDLVIHLAARVGGIGANRENPGLFFYENLVMGVHLMEEARRRGLDWVLLTVEPSNRPSIRVIEKNGGERIGQASESGYLQFRIRLPR